MKNLKNDFRLGPVVGYTDKHTSRILIEVNHLTGILVECIHYLGDKVVGKQSKIMKKGKPEVFLFENLVPKTTYRVVFQTLKGKFSKTCICSTREARIKTLHEPEKIIFLSCNANNIPENWDQVKKQDADWIVHLGDQIYVDKIYFQSVLSPTFDKNKIEEQIRDFYAEFWNRPEISHVLSHFPNLMMFDDHDFCTDSSMLSNPFFSHFRHTEFIQIAKRMIEEYQLSLFPNHSVVRSPVCHSKWISFPTFALLILDCRSHWTAEGIFHPKQKKWIKENLENSNHARLILTTSMSILSLNFPQWINTCLSYLLLDRDFVELSLGRRKDICWLLGKMKEWKKLNRKMVWIAGDLHFHQHATIQYKDKDNSNELICPYYVSSAITSAPLSGTIQTIYSWIPVTFGFTNYENFKFEVHRQRFQNNFLLVQPQTLQVKCKFM